MEAAISLEGVDAIPGLEAFLRGRATTAGTVAAAFAAATCTALSGPTATDGVGMMHRFDRELDARLPSPALRTVSRRLGRQLLRAGRVVWPGSQLDELAAAMPRGLHQPVALGAIAAAAGLSADAVAAAAVHEAVTGPATAAVRLLGLDPFTVHATLARIGPELDVIAARAALHAHAPPESLPAWSSPLLDILAEHHTTWEVRLFAS
jgi:urease accessory protein